MDRQLIAGLRAAGHLIDVGEIEPRVDALRIQVKREAHQIDIAGALAIAKQRALDALRPCHDGKLRGRDRSAAIIMGMHADDLAIPPGDITAKPLDLVGINIRRRHLHRRRQIEYGLALRRRLPHRIDRIAYLDRKIHLRAGETFRAVLENPFRVGVTQRVLAHRRGTAHRDVDDAGTIAAKHDAPLRGRGRIVDMHDRAPRTLQRFVRSRNQCGPRLRQHLDGHIVGNQFFLDDFAHKIEIGLRGGRKSHLDLLEADFHQHVEHAPLTRRIHRFDQRLIAVAQINAAPHWRGTDHPAGPGPVDQTDRRKGSILRRRIAQHRL